MGVKNRLLEIRLQKGFKFAKDFALYLGVSHNQYSRYENNRIQPNLDTTYQILEKLQIDFFELYYLEK